MRRFISLLSVAVLLCQAAIVIAQDSGEPSTKSVLDAARAKYWQDKAQDGQSADPDESPVPYAPILISFVPGVSAPFGYYDAGLAAGVIGNLTRDITGAQAAGIFNLSRDVRGFEGAGVFNLSRSALGYQGAGVFNIVDQDFAGFQQAGVFNIVHGKMMGFQGAGVFNMAGRVYAPLQAAGVFNMADEIYGFQAAGLFNIAGSVAGGQVAGLFNSAKRVSGIQVGLVNVADHIDGIQLGLINIAGNGVNSIGLSYEPATDFLYAHLQAGTPALYTVVGMGAPSKDWGSDIGGFVASFGLGSRSRAFGLNIDLDISAVQPLAGLPGDQSDCDAYAKAMDSWFRPYPSLRLMAGLPLGRHLQIVGGLKADLDFEGLGDRVPEALKGDVWKGSLFGEGFSAYYKWFFGLKI